MTTPQPTPGVYNPDQGMSGQGWQPIATAPRDGTDIFVWGVLELSPHSRPHVGCEDVERVSWDGHGWALASAQCDGFTWACGVEWWMPLPAPPEVSA